MSLTKHHNVQASFLVDDDYVINKTTLNNMNDIPFVKSSFRVFWLRLLHEQEACSAFISLGFISVRSTEWCSQDPSSHFRFTSLTTASHSFSDESPNPKNSTTRLVPKSNPQIQQKCVYSEKWPRNSESLSLPISTSPTTAIERLFRTSTYAAR